jgi:hypothetical protein
MSISHRNTLRFLLRLRATYAVLLAGRRLNPMEVLFIVLAVIAAGTALVFFMNSSMGMQLVHKKTVSTILNDVAAIQCSAPQIPLHEIY